MTDRRKETASPIADLSDEVLRLVPQLSDEEWRRRDAEIAAERAADADRVPMARLDELLASGFPRRAVDVVQSGVDREPAVERVRGFVTSSDILVLSGPRGCGKTVAATWWAAQRRGTIRFLRASTFAASSRYDRAERADMLAHQLVLDDLGAEYADSKGSFVADLDELIDVFYGDRRALVITTNSSKEDFFARYDARIQDRLRECGRWISLTGESLRRRPGAAPPQPKAAT